MKRHPDSSLTVLEAYEKHYDRSELSKQTDNRNRGDLRRFESFVGPVAVGDIDNALLARFRQQAVGSGRLTPTTINGTWCTVRSVLRALSKPWDRNPHGLSIIDGVPYMKPVKVVRELPRTVPLDDISRVYVACRWATHPCSAGIPPVDLWRCLLVLAYTTGLRKADLLGIRMADIDRENRTLTVTARKTRKPDRFPLHECAVAHIARIWGEREYLLPGFGERGGRFYRLFHRLLERAGLDQDERFGLHDIRRTAATEAEKIRPGGGSLLMQHSRNDITGRFYLNLSDVVRDVIDELPLPIGFNSGPKMANRNEAQVREARAEVYADDFHYPTGPIPADWQFSPYGFGYRGRWFQMSGRPLELLRLLTRNFKPLSVPDLLPIVAPDGDPLNVNVQTRVQVVVSQLRRRLRRCLGLEPGWNCLPCVEQGKGGRWILHIPHTLDRRETPHTPRMRIDSDAVTPAELRRAREAAGLSQYKLASLLGVSRSHVNDWEGDRANIAEKWFRKLRELLHPHLDRSRRATA